MELTTTKEHLQDGLKSCFLLQMYHDVEWFGSILMVSVDVRALVNLFALIRQM